MTPTDPCCRQLRGHLRQGLPFQIKWNLKGAREGLDLNVVMPACYPILLLLLHVPLQLLLLLLNLPLLLVLLLLSPPLLLPEQLPDVCLLVAAPLQSVDR